MGIVNGKERCCRDGICRLGPGRSVWYQRAGLIDF